MKYIVILWCMMLGYSYDITPKYCVNCMFFRKEWMTDNRHGKCSLFLLASSSVDELVTGHKHTEYHYCSSARSEDTMCGREGTKYKPRLTRIRF
jgi:hypothetical protein